MQFLKHNLAEEIKPVEPQDIKDYMKEIEIKKERLALLHERYTHQSHELEQDIQQLEKTSFDMIVRKVIDSGMIYMNCPHKDISKNEQGHWNMTPSDGFSMDPWLSRERIIGRRDTRIVLGSELVETGIFYGTCKKCHKGINRHDCSVEGEAYYFTCDEARVVNNVARQYGVKGSIHTATQIQD